jgi:hypothetical protein
MSRSRPLVGQIGRDSLELGGHGISQQNSLGDFPQFHRAEFRVARFHYNQPRPPSQHVSQIVRHWAHCSFCLISISGPPQTGHAGRLAGGGEAPVFATGLSFRPKSACELGLCIARLSVNRLV